VKVMIAGGGTGGHLFPGIALADEISTRHPRNRVVFVGTDRGLEARVVPASGYALETIPVHGLKGMGPLKLLKGLLALPRAFFASAWLLWKHKPDVVIGVGGYASGPVVLAAWLQRVPTAVQEQNTLPGLTNKLLGKIVQSVFVSFEEARAFFSAGKTSLVGNPVRRALLENYLRSRVAHERFELLVFGGSLGARGLNARVVEALSHLKDLGAQLHVTHQAGKADVEQVRKAYADAGVSADVVEFIDDMSRAYALADLVVCRAGATTVAELTVCKKASILVPFPHATDNHQELNARALVDSGAALMFRESELTGEKLAQAIRGLHGDRERLAQMEKKAALLGRPEAAKEIADALVQMMVDRWGPDGRTLPPGQGKG
jgi:UDP-N-acetylglucosamine--N-acetylmuramyl-(pentapeptide) pyrophosphoryl-undecaprenol N-acetylglucosamine transferase